MLVDVAAAGDERAAVGVHVGERAKPVMLQLEDPIGMVERGGNIGTRRHTVSIAGRAYS
jgi:hypothetical protein